MNTDHLPSVKTIVKGLKFAADVAEALEPHLKASPPAAKRPATPVEPPLEGWRYTVVAIATVAAIVVLFVTAFMSIGTAPQGLDWSYGHGQTLQNEGPAPATCTKLQTAETRDPDGAVVKRTVQEDSVQCDANSTAAPAVSAGGKILYTVIKAGFALFDDL